jgi:hypothetical protein
MAGIWGDNEENSRHLTLEFEWPQGSDPGDHSTGAGAGGSSGALIGCITYASPPTYRNSLVRKTASCSRDTKRPLDVGHVQELVLVEVEGTSNDEHYQYYTHAGHRWPVVQHDRGTNT